MKGVVTVQFRLFVVVVRVVDRGAIVLVEGRRWLGRGRVREVPDVVDEEQQAIAGLVEHHVLGPVDAGGIPRNRDVREHGVQLDAEHVRGGTVEVEEVAAVPGERPLPARAVEDVRGGRAGGVANAEVADAHRGGRVVVNDRDVVPVHHPAAEEVGEILVLLGNVGGPKRAHDLLFEVGPLNQRVVRSRRNGRSLCDGRGRDRHTRVVGRDRGRRGSIARMGEDRQCAHCDQDGHQYPRRTFAPASGAGRRGAGQNLS